MFLMQMRFTPNEFILYGAIAGIILGFILGLILLILGIKKKKKKLGIIGFFCTLSVGVLSGLLSIIVSAIFFWLILKKPIEDMLVESENSSNPEIS